MDPKLIVLITTEIASAAFIFLLGVYVLLRGRKLTANILYFIFSLLISIFLVITVIGSLEVDVLISRYILSISLVLPIAFVVNFHLLVALANRLGEQKRVLIGFYSGAIAVIVFFLFFFGKYLHTPKPRLYIPSYYHADDYFWVMLVFVAALIAYGIYFFIRTYLNSNELIKNKITFFLIGNIIGFFSIVAIFLLAFEINFDPAYSAFIWLAFISIAYSVLSIKPKGVMVTIRRSIYIAISTVITSLVITLISFSSNFVESRLPDFPAWLIPTFTSVLSVAGGAYVWQRVRRSETLKYEFITVITHKFRTPLTYVKWSIADLANTKKTYDERMEALGKVEQAHQKLNSLTDVLVGLARVESAGYLYRMEKNDVAKMTEVVMKSFVERANERHITLKFETDSSLNVASYDTRRIQYALQILIENAISYTDVNGSVTVRVYSEKDRVIMRVTDTGIGIKPNEIPFIFSKFFRSQLAKIRDTEGMGIGLYMVKNIVDRHKGDVWVESPGEGKGSSFYISLRKE